MSWFHFLIDQANSCARNRKTMSMNQSNDHSCLFASNLTRYRRTFSPVLFLNEQYHTVLSNESETYRNVYLFCLHWSGPKGYHASTGSNPGSINRWLIQSISIGRASIPLSQSAKQKLSSYNNITWIENVRRLHDTKFYFRNVGLGYQSSIAPRLEIVPLFPCHLWSWNIYSRRWWSYLKRFFSLIQYYFKI